MTLVLIRLLMPFMALFMALLMALFLAIGPHQAMAMDTTVMLGLDQSWARDGRQKSKLSSLLEISQGFEANGSVTAIIRTQILGPNEMDPGRQSQPSVSPVSRRWNITDTVEFELRELYWDLDLSNGQVRLGKQQVVWGQADGLKLLDVVNPQRFREFILEEFNESRIPLWMINLELFMDFGDLQFLMIPDTSMHDLPGAGSTFEITAPFEGLPQGLPVRFDPLARPDSVIVDADYGLRLSMFRSGWDLTINYIYHYDDFPVIRRSLGADGLRLSFGYERTHTVGGSASTAFGDFILRSEVAYNTHKFVQTDVGTAGDGTAASKEIGYVVGIDWSGMTDTLLSLQLFQSILLDDARYVRDDIDTNLTFLLRRDFLNESLSLELLWIYHVNDNDGMLRFKTDYEMTSNVTVSLYADLFSGDADELFGQFDNLDQIGLRFSVGF